uniref:Group II intron maturase-specific domain-containing protein n=1 Tax=Enterobacter asburiae TaxID=61645 RepID=A0A455W5M9_ENTAS|nr:hypothetical protein MRY18106EAS_P0850 [Enterobacter asburiae]
MDKPRITHVNDGFIFLGHRIIRKRSRYGEMRVVSTILKEKTRYFAASLTALLSGNYSESKVDMAEQLNRKLKDWSPFYQFVDFKVKVFSYIDRAVFWKLAHWLARKYRTGIASLMRWWFKSPKPCQGKARSQKHVYIALYRSGNGVRQHLNRADALKGARPVRGGEAGK